MIGFLVGVALTISVVNLIFFLVGYFAAKGSLEEKVKQIIRVRNPEKVGGAVKPLEPGDLEKKRSREIIDKYT